MAGGSLRAAPVAEALGRCCVVLGGRVGWAPARWADGAVPARLGSRGVLRVPPAEGGASSGGTPGGRAQPGRNRAHRGRPADCGHGLKMREGRDTPAILASFVDAG